MLCPRVTMYQELKTYLGSLWTLYPLLKEWLWPGIHKCTLFIVDFQLGLNPCLQPYRSSKNINWIKIIAVEISTLSRLTSSQSNIFSCIMSSLADSLNQGTQIYQTMMYNGIRLCINEKFFFTMFPLPLLLLLIIFFIVLPEKRCQYIWATVPCESTFIIS